MSNPVARLNSALVVLLVLVPAVSACASSGGAAPGLLRRLGYRPDRERCSRRPAAGQHNQRPDGPNHLVHGSDTWSPPWQAVARNPKPIATIPPVGIPRYGNGANYTPIPVRFRAGVINAWIQRRARCPGRFSSRLQPAPAGAQVSSQGRQPLGNGQVFPQAPTGR